MKSVCRLVFWSILCCIALFVVTAAMPAFAADVPAARLEGDAIEPEMVEAPNTSVYELPKMDFVPAQIEEAASPVVEVPAPAETKPAVVKAEPPVEQVKSSVEPTEKKAETGRYARNKKISGRIREYWLKIHGEPEAAPVDDVKKEKVVTPLSSQEAKVIAAPATEARNEAAVSSGESRREGTIIRQVPVEQKPIVAKTEPAVEEPRLAVEEPKAAVEEPKAAVEEPKPVFEETKGAVEETKPVSDIPEKKVESSLARADRKLSTKVRGYWLKLHAQEEEGQIVAREPMSLPAAAQPAKPQIVPQTTQEEKTDKPVVGVEPSAGESKVEIASAEPARTPESKDETFAPAPTVTSPPLSEAPPVVFQKKSSKLALFSGPLAKMAQRREYRMAEAKRLNIVLPSQGGSFDKLPQSICKLKSTVEDILTRNGAGLVLSMIFKGRFAGGSANQKRTNR
ncbi:MAG: hypothetical protein BWY66_01388 [bacterium ADurb.Bin374]|nr:MAG: hypothetical protein BWY66_01388 [bacterium ADurb.Bin374]